MGFKRYLRIALIVLIVGILAFSSIPAAMATEYWYDDAWIYGGDDAIPFTDLGFSNWGWTNGSYSEGTYYLDLYASAYDNILENGGIAGFAVLTYDNGYARVMLYIHDDFFVVEDFQLWIGETPLPPGASGEFWNQFTHQSGTYYPFQGNIYVAMHVDIGIDPIVAQYGADAANPTGNPIGGGDGYTDIISRNDPDVDYIVDTKSELLTALQSAQSGDIIYVEEYANIDMYRTSDTQIPAGVTLASNRGENGSLGGRIYTSRGGTRLFYIAGENVRVTGLRLEGPHKTTSSISKTNICMSSYYQNLEVDNCELFGWSNAAIGLNGTGGADMRTGGYIHHNDIHHNQTAGYGYGICVSNGGVALIEANYFDYCRHAITGTGVVGDGYEARYNICGPNWITTSPHNFDMHGQYDSGSGTTIAGDTIKIYNNTFMCVSSPMPTCVVIRGVPRDGAYISNNWFYFTNEEPVWQKDGQENIFMTNNLIGAPPNEELSVKGPIKYY